jgi:hypothetical protein
MFDVPLTGFLQERLKIGNLRALFHKVVYKTELKTRVLERGHKTLEEPHDSPFTDLSTRI